MSEVTEENKEGLSFLETMNFQMFEELMNKEVARGLNKRKLIPKSFKAVSMLQVEGITS